MTELDKQIAELKQKAAQEIHPIHFDPTDFKSYDAAFDGGFDDGKIIMARKAIKIIESLQAENQQLRGKLEIARKALNILAEEPMDSFADKIIDNALSQLNKETKGGSNER